MGVYEKIRDAAFFVDLTLNRINIKGGKSQSFTIADTPAIQECVDKQPLILGTDFIYHFSQAGADKYAAGGSPILRVNLAELTDQEWKVLETVVQFAQLEIGILSAADGSVSDLNASKTATGIMSNERSGTALQNKTGDLHASCFKKILSLAIDLILENMPPRVAFYLQDGQTLATLSREEMRHLDRDVRLLLTKARSTESLQRNAQAAQLVEAYLAKPKALQKKVRQFYVEQLQALDVQDSDDKLPEPTDEEIDAEAEAAQAAAQATQKPPSAAVSTKIELMPSERAQVVAREFGITPASEQEVAAAQAQNQQQQHTPVPSHHEHPSIPAVA